MTKRGYKQTPEHRARIAEALRGNRNAPEGADSLLYRHGHARHRTYSREYRSWQSMKTRCFNPNRTQHRDWGGRGITITGRWLGADGFTNFLADMGERPEGRTLDRIDPDGNYEPGNCRWATYSEQRTNRRKGVTP